MTEAYAVRSCPLCGADELSVDLADSRRIRDNIPAYDIDARNARTFEVGGFALLHHACPSRQANTDTAWWPEGAWWACRHPKRSLDADALFDLNCPDCLFRWAESRSP